VANDQGPRLARSGLAIHKLFAIRGQRERHFEYPVLNRGCP
jgi:hypothetical protein